MFNCNMKIIISPPKNKYLSSKLHFSTNQISDFQRSIIHYEKASLNPKVESVGKVAVFFAAELST